MEEAQKETTRVAIFTKDYRIVGNIALLPGGRLTDYMTETKQFLAVTDAEITPLCRERAITVADFLDVNRDSIQFIMPAAPGDGN